MLQVGQTGDISFKVNVMGTSVLPEVRVVVATSPEICVAASKSADGWIAHLPVPSCFEAGMYELRIEVILNNRIFTPLRKKIMIDAAEVDVTASMGAPAQAEPASYKDELPAMTDAPAEMEIELPSVEKSIEVAIEPKPTLLKSLSRMAEAVEEPVAPKKVYTPIITPLPKPAEAKPAPVRLTISELSKVAGDRPVGGKKPKTAPIVEITQKPPIRLVRGEVIFE